MFLWDVRREPIDEAITAFYRSLASEEEDDPQPIAKDDFMETLVRGTTGKTEELDRRISGKSEHWRLERMAAVDRNILRLAVYEMTDIGTPAPVVIDEALELARKFSGDESVSFINGVLDAIHKDAITKDQP